ncbi:lecithin retinol acyltransferase family protein [Calothrix sp. FACHB-1219]|uniref:lecithin retinol acyltransferase family protein n=1 Tax=unclassified Calothrix TaxID=2619626 RepID=UPI00168498C3|nr:MULTISPECIES: lecithin retinol acyltransferase family protein [unclassified Calothrix]MBD2206863.1 lecithin retinol acyltransferase family protein [Calothrix sp. FACHB-168]MBD2219534.1 lecithin retinol acyltransferase family protein [Calothrix sp. FACHB-1219]
MQFQVGDILSVELFAHTRHFFVYVGNGEIIEWGPWDGISWMGGKGHVFRRELFKAGLEYKWLGGNGELQEITLEKRTGVSEKLIIERIKWMTTGIDYHVGHRNCEHFAHYVTGHTPHSDQSIWHLFTDHDPFTSQPMISDFSQLREALLRCKFCGYVNLSREDFNNAVFVSKLKDGYYTYHLSHPLGGQHLYVTSVSKSENFESSYDSIVLAYFGAFFGRGEILSIIRQLRGC